MIEAISNIGIGGGFGPGMMSRGGCIYESSLGQNAFGRIACRSPDRAVEAMAYDAATARSEIAGEPIGMYRLKVKEVPYLDKSTGDMVTEITLISPDFNDEPVAVWTDAGEYGTGTEDEYKRILTRANRLAQTDGNASMFWVSPGNEGEDTVTPHRAYLWVKKGEDVTAYSYSLAGSIDVLSKTMENLGYREDAGGESLENRTLIQKGKTISHHDVYHAFVTSLSKDELRKAESFIAHFQKESETGDNIREKRLANYQKQYEKEIKSYKKDIRHVLESFAQGFAAIPRVFDEIKNPDIRVITAADPTIIRHDDGRLDYSVKAELQELAMAEEQFTPQVIVPVIPLIIAVPQFMDKLIDAHTVFGSKDKEMSGYGEVQVDEAEKPDEIINDTNYTGQFAEIRDFIFLTAFMKSPVIVPSEPGMIHQDYEKISDTLSVSGDMREFYVANQEVLQDAAKITEDLMRFHAKADEDGQRLLDMRILFKKLSIIISSDPGEPIVESLKPYLAFILHQEIQTSGSGDKENNNKLTFLMEGLKQIIPLELYKDMMVNVQSEDYSRFILLILYVLIAASLFYRESQDINAADIIQRLENIGKRIIGSKIFQLPNVDYSVEKLLRNDYKTYGAGYNNKKMKRKKTGNFPRNAIIYYCTHVTVHTSNMNLSLRAKRSNLTQIFMRSPRSPD